MSAQYQTTIHAPRLSSQYRTNATYYPESISTRAGPIQAGDSCPICNDEIRPFERVAIHRGCRNFLCGSCLQKWIKQDLSKGGPHCPFCRRSLMQAFDSDLVKWT
jgi:hypothetical protein